VYVVVICSCAFSLLSCAARFDTIPDRWSSSMSSMIKRVAYPTAPMSMCFGTRRTPTLYPPSGKSPPCRSCGLLGRKFCSHAAVIALVYFLDRFHAVFLRLLRKL
jgi:hypothetical protein